MAEFEDAIRRLKTGAPHFAIAMVKAVDVNNVPTFTEGEPAYLMIDKDTGELLTSATGGGGAGTEYTEGDVVAAADGPVFLGKQSDNTVDAILIDSSRRIVTAPKDISTDDIVIGAQFDDAATATASEDAVGLLRMTEYRGLHVNVRGSSGTEIALATSTLQTTANNLLTTIDTDTGNIATSVSSIDTKITACNTGAVVLAAGTASIGKLGSNAGVTIGAVEIAASQTIGLAAGTNGIGKLTSNSGVTIGAVELAASQTLATVTTVSTVTNLSQLGGAAINMGAGSVASGTQRVTLANDDPVAGVFNTGLTVHHAVSAASTNATNVKNAAGKLHGWFIKNNSSDNIKVAFHNTSGTPTAGASIYFTMTIPPLAAANVMCPVGIAFSSGIAYTTVTGSADSDTTAVGLNDVGINLFYI